VISLPRFNVILSNKAEKGLVKSDPKIKPKLMQAIDELETNPVPSDNYNVTKVTGSRSNYRIKIIPYRILYTIVWEIKEIRVYDIDRKKDRTYK